MSDASEYAGNRRGYRRLLSRRSFDLAENTETAAAAAAATTTTTTASTLKRSKTTREVKAHPVMRILEAPTKKAAARPEFLRYLEYMREAGSWDPNSDRPTLYFK